MTIYDALLAVVFSLESKGLPLDSISLQMSPNTARALIDDMGVSPDVPLPMSIRVGGIHVHVVNK